MKIDLKKYDPPGMETDREQGLFWTGMFFSFVCSVLHFLDRYSYAYRRLWRGNSDKVLSGQAMKPFFELFGRSLMGYPIVAMCMLVAVGVRYSYYWQGSKSIYLMRRLPDGKLLHRTCWTAPMIRMGLCVLIAGLTLLLCFATYVGFTPAECLPWNYGG